MWPGTSNIYLRSVTDHPFWIGTNNGKAFNDQGSVKFCASGDDYRTIVYKDLEVVENVGITGSLEVGTFPGSTPTVKVNGQIYTPQMSWGSDDDGARKFNFGYGNVHRWHSTSATSLTINNPSYVVAGGLQTIILDNSNNNSPVTLTFESEWKFANGIKPNLVRANSDLVISVVCQIIDGTTRLLCTWAEDFS